MSTSTISRIQPWITTDGPFRTWRDEKTGREVRQLTGDGYGGGLNYFRFPRHLPDGRMLGRISLHKKRDAAKPAGAPKKGATPPHLILIEPDASRFTLVDGIPGGLLRLRESDGTYFTLEPHTNEIWATNLTGVSASNRPQPRLVGKVPADLHHKISDITCDGRTLIMLDNQEADHHAYPAPTKKDAAMFWHYVSRPRSGKLLAYDIASGKTTVLYETQGVCPFHAEAHPTDPTLVRFALDNWEGLNQRVFAIRTDGTGFRKMRSQETGELVTHEFWWSDNKHMGFTYQDRRGDAAHHELPWCEYAPVETRLGITDLDGKQVYLSDPVNHYHTHLYRSHNGKLLSGSGTDGHSFVYAANFSMNSTKVNYVAQATIHTPYVPFRGQHVNCDFSADGKWLLYTDSITEENGETHGHLCAVRVEL